MHKPVTIRERVNPKNACHSERSGVSAANGTQSRNPAKQRLAWIAGFLDSATPRTLQQSAGLRFARNDTRFFKLSLYFAILNRRPNVSLNAQLLRGSLSRLFACFVDSTSVL